MNFLNGIDAVRNFWDFKAKVDFVDKLFLMESPIPILIIWLSYMFFILKLGPYYMKKRAAFKLNGLLIVYNTAQMISSAYMVYLGIKLLKPVKYIYFSCAIDKETMIMIINGMHYFVLAKISEFLESIFFVLRKKQNQVSFLHVYHHTLVVLHGWMLLKFEPSHLALFSGMINSFVHVIMYAYYALSVFPSLSKYLWWKKYITRMQLIQFTIINIHALGNFMFSECDVPATIMWTILFISTSFACLFINFYMKAYRKDNNVVESRTTTANGKLKQKNI